MTREELARKCKEAVEAMDEAYKATIEMAQEDDAWAEANGRVCQDTVEPHYTLRRMLLAIAKS